MSSRAQTRLSELLVACVLCLVASGCLLSQPKYDWRLLYLNDQGEIEREPGPPMFHIKPAYVRSETRRPIGILTDRLSGDTLREAQRKMTVEALEIGSSTDSPIGSERRAKAVSAISELKKLKSLDIRGLATSELHYIGPLPELKSLCCHADADADGLVDFLKRHPSIESLELHGTAESGDLKLLSATPQLQELEWHPGKAVADEELQYLQFVPKLRELHIHSAWQQTPFATQITDEGLRHIADLPNLESLEMPLEGEGLRRLAKMTSLRELTIPKRYYPNSGSLASAPIAFGEENLTFLADAANLVSLKLPRGITITDVSASALSRMKSLKQLELPDSAMTAAGYQIVFDRPKQSILDLTIPISDEVIEVLAARSAVQRIEARSGKISAEGFRKLRELKSLKYLRLTGDWETIDGDEGTITQSRLAYEADDVVAFARSRPDVYVCEDSRFIQGRRVVTSRPSCGCMDDPWEDLQRALRRDDAFVQAREDAEEKWKRSILLR